MGRSLGARGWRQTGDPADWLAPPLRVLEKSVYRGPHLYSHTPMVRFQLDLGLLEDWPTDRLPGFSEQLLAMLPGLMQHGCSLQQPGGFVSRLNEGTWIGHVAEHVALELQCAAGSQVTRGKTRSVKGSPGVYNVMYEYEEEMVGLCAGRSALQLLVASLQPPFNRVEGLEVLYDGGEDVETFSVAGAVERLRSILRERRLGPTTRAIVAEAERRGIPSQRLDDSSFVQLGTGRHQKRIRAGITGWTPYLAVEAAGDKHLTKQLLADAGVPVPEGRVVHDVEEALEAAKEIGYPLVVKPLDGNHGRGVATNLRDEQQVRIAFQSAKEHSRSVVIEQFNRGRDHRILVIAGEVVAVAERVAAHVIGDGKNTVAALIAQLNADPRRGEGHEEVMTRIKIDDALSRSLAKASLTLDSVPSAGTRVCLSDTANLSAGGTAVDRTDDIHPDNMAVARRATLALGLDVAGIDMIIPDISRSWRETGGVVVEVNASPGFRMHLQPSEGKPRDVGRPVVSMLFPKSAEATVPLVAITGTNGKSTTVRMLAHILRQGCKTVGFTSTSGIFVNDECLWEGDASGPRSAKLLLRNPTIDYALVETARGGILREGLGFACCDVGAVLNVTADHLGMKGIETIEDLAAVKSVVTESVSAQGVSVLNADDPLTRDMARHAGGHICFTSMNPDDPFIRQHIGKGCLAVVREHGMGRDEIVIYADGRRLPLMAVNEIPATLGGLIRFNIQNALAATAVASALNVDRTMIRAALSVFSSSYEQNPGRMNIYDGHGFRVIMDYAHNPAALEGVLDTLRKMRANYRRVIGCVSTPGDRTDEHIRNMGRIAADQFDQLVFRELPDNRGRELGEVTRLLSEGAIEAGCPQERIVCISAEEEANDYCLRSAQPGDLVLITPSMVSKAWKQVLSFKPAPASRRKLRIAPSQLAAHA